MFAVFGKSRRYAGIVVVKNKTTVVKVHIYSNMSPIPFTCGLLSGSHLGRFTNQPRIKFIWVNYHISLTWIVCGQPWGWFPYKNHGFPGWGEQGLVPCNGGTAQRLARPNAWQRLLQAAREEKTHTTQRARHAFLDLRLHQWVIDSYGSYRVGKLNWWFGIPTSQTNESVTFRMQRVVGFCWWTMGIIVGFWWLSVTNNKLEYNLCNRTSRLSAGLPFVDGASWDHSSYLAVENGTQNPILFHCHILSCPYHLLEFWITLGHFWSKPTEMKPTVFRRLALERDITRGWSDGQMEAAGKMSAALLGIILPITWEIGNFGLTYRERWASFLWGRCVSCFFLAALWKSVTSQQVSYSMTGSFKLQISKVHGGRQHVYNLHVKLQLNCEIRSSCDIQLTYRVVILHTHDTEPRFDQAQNSVNTREFCTTSNNGKDFMFNSYVARVLTRTYSIASNTHIKFYVYII